MNLLRKRGGYYCHSHDKELHQVALFSLTKIIVTIICVPMYTTDSYLQLMDYLTVQSLPLLILDFNCEPVLVELSR